MEEIRPPSGLYLPIVFEKVVERYAFVVRPQNVAEAITAGAKFLHGRLQTHNKTLFISEMGIFNDGIIVDSVNTDDAEFILEDVISWVTATFALQPMLTIIPRRFTSAVTIEFTKPVEPYLKGLSAMAGQMANAFKQTYGEEVHLNLMRLAINADPLTVTHLKNTQFLIERRIQRPYAENRYHCTAPLRTEDHVALLENIEVALHGIPTQK
jgi:hypothetical protein